MFNLHSCITSISALTRLRNAAAWQAERRYSYHAIEIIYRRFA
jgi:hypothetical protein